MREGYGTIGCAGCEPSSPTGHGAFCPVETPEWMTREGSSTLANGYLLPGEGPRSMYRRVAKAAAERLGKPELEVRFLDAMWKGWLCPASPVAANMGTSRGLPISCITGDMLVNTYTGGKYAKDVVVGDLVLTHKNRWEPVTATAVRKSSGDLFELTVGLRTSKIKITGNHPVLTNLGWVRVDALDPNVHLVAVNTAATYPEKPYRISLEKHCKFQYVEEEGRICKAIVGKKRLRNGKTASAYCAKPFAEVDVDEELSWALGLWFAEGGVSGGYVGGKKKPSGLTLTMGLHESSIVERWLEVMTRRFGVLGGLRKESVQREGKVNSWVQANVNSVLLGTYFYEEFGKNCKVKALPAWILELPNQCLKEFLGAFVLGDGHVTRGGVASITISNPYLLLGLYNIALKLQYACSLNLQAKAGRFATTRYVYRLSLLEAYKNQLRTHSVSSGIRFGDLVYAPIRKLCRVVSDEDVYDFTVSGDHSFSVCGVVVHNCYSLTVPDSVDGIFKSVHELAMLSKYGGGVGACFSRVRGRNTEITGNGRSEGVIPWLKAFDATICAVSQGNVRRGATAAYLHIDHPDLEEFLQIRKPEGDQNRRCMNLNHAVVITDEFMRKVEAGDEKAREKWTAVLKARFETGEPYILFIDTVNRANPQCYKDLGLAVETSNICTEIVLHTDEEHTFVCCLSSLNLSKYHEWKGTDLPYIAIWMLEGVMSEFLEKARGLPGFERAVRFAEKSRALGLGVLGWHTLLQESGIPFDSFKANTLNAKIFKEIREQAERATVDIAKEYGEPEWCKGYGRRHTHLMALAPTVSNSTISGNVSPSIEPLVANAFTKKSAKGTFLQQNPTLKKLLAEKGKDTPEVWKQIVVEQGSVQNLPFLSKEEKEVFLTAREINQMALVRQAASRQRFVDQAQSLNLFFPSNVDPNYFHRVHMLAWKEGVKSLYYCRTGSVLKGDIATRFYEETCQACSG